MMAGEAMSEFKFACPVCGQHITADASSSGGQIECPTCFQKIVVPQAPGSVDTKFILSASQVAKPRPLPAETLAAPLPMRPSFARRAAPTAILLLVLFCAGGAAFYLWPRKAPKTIAVIPPTSVPASEMPPGVTWSLDVKAMTFPTAPAAGRVHGRSFSLERATLDGGTLSLRQGKTWPPDLGVTINIPGQPGDGLAGKTLEIAADQPPPVPQVVLRWKDEQGQNQKQEIRGGYALKLVFGQPDRGHMLGKVYLCVSDESKSVVAGNFSAAIRRPKGDKGKGPRPPGPPNDPASSRRPAAGTPHSSP
jgi:hypothetical protein